MRTSLHVYIVTVVYLGQNRAVATRELRPDESCGQTRAAARRELRPDECCGKTSREAAAVLRLFSCCLGSIRELAHSAGLGLGRASIFIAPVVVAVIALTA